MRLCLLIALGLVSGCGSSPAVKGLNPNVQRGVVVRASDGDTIVVQEADKVVKVRLLGVDTPETHDPRKPVQCYGPEAAEFTRRYAVGKVTITTEPASGDTVDKYGRVLGYVYVLGHRSDLGAVLVRRGFARVYAYADRRFSRRARYMGLEERARQKRLGRWGACP